MRRLFGEQPYYEGGTTRHERARDWRRARRAAFRRARVACPIVAGLALVVLFAWHSLRVSRPLIEPRLFRVGGFRADAIATFLLAAALFGSLLAAGPRWMSGQKRPDVY